MRILVVGAALAGCGGGELTCDYLASSTNCWKVTASAAVSCLPADTDIGALAADNGSCSYASGHVITFATPLTLPLLTIDVPWDFTVTADGLECMHYVSDSSGLALTVGNRTVRESLVQSDLEITCPDGSQLARENAFTYFQSCPGGHSNLPGSVSSSGPDSVQFGLLNTRPQQSGNPEANDVLTVFSCRR